MHISEQKKQVENQAASPGDRAYEVGLSMYSLRQLFQSCGGELDALDYPRFAKETFGITQIDVWDGGLPKSKRQDPDYYLELRKRAELAGANIFLLMAGEVDSCATDLQEQADAFIQQVDLVEILGARYLRVFILTPTSVDRSESLKAADAALRPIADYAASKGVILVVEPQTNNHSADGYYLSRLAVEMNHPSLRLMPDFGKMRETDLYGGTIAMMPYTEVVSAKTLEFSAEGLSREFDYPRLMRSVVDAGFGGIVAIEYEGEELGPVEGVRASQRLLNKLNRRNTCIL